MKSLFLSFADSSLTPSLKRIEEQANQMHIFDKIFIYNEKRIPHYIKKRIKYVIKHTNSKRGYGYWSWKPALINFILNTEMDDGDLLLYCDAGCDINPQCREKLSEYFELTKKHDILVSQFDNNEFCDYYWSKSDTIKLFEGKITVEKLNQGQIQGGIIFMIANPYTRKIANTWENLMSEDNLHYFDDSPSIISNNIGFKEHRHDQSIFSLLLKSEHYYSLSVEQHFGTGNTTAEKRLWLKENEPIVSFGHKTYKKRFKQTEFYLCIRYPRYLFGKIRNFIRKKQ